MIRFLGLIIRTLRGWCRRLIRASQMPPGTQTVREVLTDGLTALSSGDVFEFRATLALTWHSTGLDDVELRDAIECHRGMARSTVCDSSRDLRIATSLIPPSSSNVNSMLSSVSRGSPTQVRERQSHAPRGSGSLWIPM